MESDRKEPSPILTLALIVPAVIGLRIIAALIMSAGWTAFGYVFFGASVLTGG
jgi:hypothetical protein